ncbi:MAG: phosphoribosylformylglycinamidine cyclo-ligase, partial [Lachnospiraceae bacterium]|nr:phosphoribosylformylglycinamidine cyclo-ligase [Lachnospiraceae bacterium]
LAGFSVGVVDKDKIIDHDTIREGDMILALPSSGAHSNGFSLLRKIFDVENADLGRYVEDLGTTIGEALLKPTRIYVRSVLKAHEKVTLKAVSHITGGGFYENVPRALPNGYAAVIEKKSIRTPALFDLIAKTGNIDERTMFNTFNMGVGMTLITDRTKADEALACLKESGEDAYIIGHVEKNAEGGVVLC